ncbi:MAG: FAD-dependent oxidoreductase [Beijerinckiaceae bacterium]|jgi:3-phenylpropionate/trans-cinnamate dioxygenase ferredoxin reductase subunit
MTANARLNENLIVIGGSYAGFQVAASARELGYGGAITIIGEELDAPYHRPPLSKAFLTGKTSELALALRAPQFYAENRIDLRPGVRAVRLDRQAKFVETSAGARLDYTHLVLATGARPRILGIPGHGLEGVMTLRSLGDARRLRVALETAASVAVIGGGFIGLEAASAAATLGKPVTVFEARDRLLARAASPPLAGFVQALHREHGVIIKTGAVVTSLRGDAAGHVRAVVLGDGTAVPADLVIVGIGVVPNIELALEAGLVCDDGIVVDAYARTSDPAILAAGDCTRHPSPFAPGLIRLESVQNALDQAKTAAATLVGQDKPYGTPPWFWSDQFDVKLQMVGFSDRADTHVRRGRMEEHKFSLFHFKDGVLTGVESVNRAADHMLARRLLAARVAITPELAGDASADLAALLKAAPVA